MATETLTHYKSILGLKADADMDAVNTAYFTLVEAIASNPTEEESRRLQEIQHAYGILKRAVARSEEIAAEAAASARPRTGLRSLAGALVLLGALAGVLFAMNLGRVRLAVVHHEPGAVLYVKGRSEAFGTVVGFNRSHAFSSGPAGPAYEIRPEGAESTIWVGEQTVELTMSAR